VWTWTGPTFTGACLDADGPDLLYCQNNSGFGGSDCHRLSELPPACVPPGALNGACAGFADGHPCAWYWLGGNFSRVCLLGDPLDVEVCSTHLFGPGFECHLLSELLV
jgi:hypothetical protein